MVSTVPHVTSDLGQSLGYRDPHARRLYVSEGGVVDVYFPYGGDITLFAHTGIGNNFVTKRLMVQLPAFCPLYIPFLPTVRERVVSD